MRPIVWNHQRLYTKSPGEGGTYYICPTGMCCFSGYHFCLFSLEQGIKRRQVFWRRLSKHVKNFVKSGYYLVQFLCFGVYFSPIFSRTGYHLKAKILEQDENFCFVGTSPFKFRSSTPPPRGPEALDSNISFSLLDCFDSIPATGTI